jgi:hypothetical protein
VPPLPSLLLSPIPASLCLPPQTRRHRDFFLPKMSANGPHKDAASQSARSTAELAAYRQRQREIQLAYENQQVGYDL